MDHLVVLGSVNADHVLRVPHFPRPGETLSGHSYQVIAGGKGANQAVAAARAGAKVSFIARIGQDAIGEQMKNGFIADRIDVSAVEADPVLPTGVAIIYVNEQGENSIGISAEANGALDCAMVARHESLIANADSLLLQLEVPLESVLCAAQLAKKHGTKVVLNPAPAKNLDAQLLALVDLITPNQTEAQYLTGIRVTNEHNALAAAKVLHQMGIAQVMITLGAQGVFYSDGAIAKQIAGFKVDALDTTGAGDTFNGALLAASLQGHDLEQAIRFAHAAAAISVTRYGAQSAIPYQDEIKRFLSAQQ